MSPCDFDLTIDAVSQRMTFDLVGIFYFFFTVFSALKIVHLQVAESRRCPGLVWLINTLFLEEEVVHGDSATQVVLDLLFTV